MARKRHPKAEVEAALRYAEEKGWRIETHRSHWGLLLCPFVKDARSTCGPCAEWCQNGIWSTPRDPGIHAMQIRRKIDRCLKHQAKRQEGER